MSKGGKFLLVSAGFVLLLMVAFSGYNKLSKDYKPPENTASALSPDKLKPQTAPDFTVLDVNGEEVSLSDLKGKPVVLNFWASWCPPCRSEMPDFNRANQQYRSQGVVFLMVNLTDGYRETKETALNFVKDNHYGFNIYFDVNLKTSKAFGISAIPSTFFIDKKGKITNSYEGAITEDILNDNIQALTGLK